MSRLSFLLLHMTTLSKLQVFEMVPHIVRKNYQYSMITLMFRILMILTWSVKILSVFYNNLDVSDPNDPDVIIKIVISNVFYTTDRDVTIDMISGRDSWDYSCVLKWGDVIPTVDTLTKIFGCFKSMRTCHSKLRYFDWEGQVHLAKGQEDIRGTP